MRFAPTSLVCLLAAGALSAQGAGKSVLFDHTHHEEGGTSAEWVICRGYEPNPSPANPTSETAWAGGISSLGYDLYKQGYTVQTLPASGGRITYGDSSNSMDLAHYSVFFIPECYTYFTAAEKAAIVAFVRNGGGLFLLGNHDGAARVTSSVSGSTDAFHVFNDLVAGQGFGLSWVDGHAGDSYANTTSTKYTTAVNAATDAILRGPNGTLAMQDFHSYSYVQVNTAENATAQGLLATAVSGDAAGSYFLATCTLGNGRVVVTGDSSPADDGTTTTSGKNLYNSYWINSNRAFFLNAIQYLAGTGSANQAPTVAITAPAAGASAAPGSTVSFAATASDPEGQSMTYAWTFGDGTSATGLTASHAYVNAGSYTATFTATDAQGAAGSATRAVTVATPAGNTVTASLTTPSGNLTVASGTSVSFAGTGSDSSSTATLGYAWDFGDGASATGSSASHVYSNAGSTAVTYTVTFKVTDNTGASATATRKITVNPATTASLAEGFESGTKTAYAAASVTLASGSWTLDNALLGTSSSDRKNGTQSVRMTGTGKLTMNFNFASGARTVTVAHAKYGSDAGSTWSLWYSTNSGSTWTQAGSSVTTSSTTLATASFSLNLTGAVRFQIRKTDGSSNRINFDDFKVTGQ